MTAGAWGNRTSPSDSPSNECSIAPVSPELGLKLAGRGLSAAVWTTMSSENSVILVVEDEVLVRMMALAIAEDMQQRKDFRLS